MRSNHVRIINRSGSTKSENQASIRGSRRIALGNRSRSFIPPECQFVRRSETRRRPQFPRLPSCSILSAGALLTVPLGEIRQRKQVQTGEQEQKEREQWRVDDPGGRFPQSHSDEVGDDGRRKGDREPAVDLPNPYVPVQLDLLSKRAEAGTSIDPPQHLLQLCKELRPSGLGAAVVPRLIWPKARLLHAQAGPRARWRQGPRDYTLETVDCPVVRGVPGVGQRFVRLDCQNLTLDGAPVCAKIETVVHDRSEVVLHEPLLDQVWLRERAPDLFRRMRDLTFDDDGAGFGQRFVHWSILLSRSSMWSNRLCQNPAIWLVQSISGAKALSCAL